MSKLLKGFLSIIAVIILLIIIAAIVLPMVIDPNDYKPEIQSAVKENLGRELIIDGDLELSVFPWIGISTGKLSLSNAKGFDQQQFAVIDESNIKVKLLPLISKEIEVSRIVLKGLVLNLAKNKKGVSNWEDLSSSEAPKEQATQTDKSDDNVSPLAALAIGGIEIEQAQIVWDDQQQGKYTEINDFNFKTDKFAFNNPIGIDLSMAVVNKSPELTETIKLSTDLIVNEDLKIFDVKGLKIESITSGKGIPGNKIAVNLLAEIAIDLTGQTLNISGLKLNTGNLNLAADIKGTQITDNPVFKGTVNIAEFNLAKFLQNMAMPLAAQDANAMSKAAMSFNLLATDKSADIQNLVVKLDDSNITGSTSIKNFDKPAIAFNINIDSINLDRYMAAKKQGDPKKTVATPASAAAATATLFPVDTLRALSANGQLSIGKAKVNNLNMQGLKLKLKAKNGVINSQQNISSLYQGAYSGNTTINVKHRTPSLALNERLTKVQIGPLLNDLKGEARMTGSVNATAKLQGRGNTSKALKSSLNGNLAFSFNNGLIKGFNLQKIIDNGKALIEGSALPTDNKNDQTVFSVIKGTAVVRNGLVKNNDLYAEASKLRVNGAGTASLASEKLDYKVNAKLLKAAATATTAEKVKGLPVIIKIGGTISKPSYSLDVASMLLEKNKEKLNKKKDELLKKLDEKLAPGVGDLIKGFF